jgi:hypothetical protein
MESGCPRFWRCWNINFSIVEFFFYRVRDFFNWSRVARVTRFRGYAVSKSTGVNQTSPLDRHHPTQTLETMRFGVSNAPGGLLGPEISKVGGRPSWPSGVPVEAASGRAAHHARSCSSRLIMHRQLRLKNRTMTMPCMVDRPAVCIHVYIPK